MNRKYIWMASGACVAAFVIVGCWYWMATLDSNNDAAIVIDDADKLNHQFVSYVAAAKPTGDDPGSVYLDQISKLSLDFDGVLREVDAQVNVLRTQNANLDAAIREGDIGMLMQAPERDGDVRLSGVAYEILQIIEGEIQDDPNVPSEGKSESSAAINRLLKRIYCRYRLSDSDLVTLRALEKDHANQAIVGLMLLHDEKRAASERFARWKRLTDSKQTTCSSLIQFEIAKQFGRFEDQMSGMEIAKAKVLTFDRWFNCAAEHVGDQVLLRYLCDELVRLLEQSNLYLRGDMFKRAVETPNEQFPEWMKHFFAYELAHSIASSHRGENFVHAVAQRDLAYFENYSITANKHLMKAWTLNPNNPDLACHLISQQKASGLTALPASDWFRVVLSADPSYKRGYRYYATSLQPKWGGSYRKQIEMARLCIDHAKSKPQSRIPFYAGYFIESVVSQVDHQFRYDDAKIHDLVNDLASHLAHFSPSQTEQLLEWTHISVLAKVLYDSHDYRGLRELLQAARHGFDSSVFSEHFLSMPLIRSYIALDPEAVDPEKLEAWTFLNESLVFNGDKLGPNEIAKCIEKLQIVGEFDQGDSQLAYESFEQIVGMLDQFHRGETVKVTYAGSEHLWVGWEIAVNAVDGGFEIESPIRKHVGIITPLIRFPTPFQVEATLTAQQDLVDPIGVAMFVGPYEFPYNSDERTNGVLIRFTRDDRHSQNESELSFDRIRDNGLGLMGDSFRSFSAGKKTMLRRCRLEVREGRIDAWTGKTHLSSIEEPISVDGLIQFGRHCHANIGNRTGTSKHSVTNIEVKKLESDHSTIK